MSISIDDLASSLSSSHIGQEAIDLAALQAQLARTLFSQSIAYSSGTRQDSQNSSYNTQPCNTPTSSHNFTLPSQPSEAQQHPSAYWGVGETSHGARDATEEDERMVEDLLVPPSPIVAPSAFHFPGAPPSSSKLHLTSSQASEIAPSSFTSTDPFYADMCQAQNREASPYSVFTQLGYPTQQSPFTAPASLKRREHPGPGC